VQSLLVTVGGGHLEELWLLRPRLVGIAGEVTWVAPDTPHSRSLLGGEPCIHIPLCEPRDVRATLAITRQALAVVRRGRWHSVVSTGSLPAVPFLAVARARGIPAHYIETAARVQGPSLSARLLDRVPGVHRYHQSPAWERDGWSYRGSVLDGFRAQRDPGPALRRVVVTVGTNRYGFRRMVEAVARSLPAGVSVTWQTGFTDLSGLDLPGPELPAAPLLPAQALFDAMRQADVVVSHAGVGSAITALRAGKVPVLVPRRRAHGEHVDDHQEEIAAAMARAGLATAVEAGDLDLDVLLAAAGRRAVRPDDAPPFVLDGAPVPTIAPAVASGR
jgi:UDP-N-acetylglucosamine--N-acetylmuramyl-(pentapeptide) pyrophosphoryl-undecaprenol N-acetylglucosamine transferase